MQIFYKELSLEEGFEIAQLPKNSRIVAGREVSMASGIALFQSLRHKPIKCWQCGCVADRWVSGKGRGDQVSKPVLNLFATKIVKTRKRGTIVKLVMMTRDHIIPKSKGGVDQIANLRPGCDECNSTRGSNMNAADIAFMEANPHLINPVRLAISEERAKRSAEKQAMYRERQLAENAAKESRDGKPQS